MKTQGILPGVVLWIGLLGLLASGTASAEKPPEKPKAPAKFGEELTQNIEDKLAAASAREESHCKSYEELSKPIGASQSDRVMELDVTVLNDILSSSELSSENLSAAYADALDRVVDADYQLSSLRASLAENTAMNRSKAGHALLALQELSRHVDQGLATEGAKKLPTEITGALKRLVENINALSKLAPNPANAHHALQGRRPEIEKFMNEARAARNSFTHTQSEVSKDVERYALARDCKVARAQVAEYQKLLKQPPKTLLDAERRSDALFKQADKAVKPIFDKLSEIDRIGKKPEAKGAKETSDPNP